MNALLKVTAKAIERRMQAGDTWEQAVANYPRLTGAQREAIKQELKVTE